jgi:peptide/nickel transport system permease protein
VFVLMRVVPGDPVSALLGEQASAADRAALARALGTDRPLLAQLAAYYAGLVRGDLGTSLHLDAPVAALLLDRLPATLALAGAALCIGLGLGLPLGTAAALRQGGWLDHAVRLAASTVLALPVFVLGPLLTLALAVRLGVLPLGGEGAASLALPALTLGIGIAAVHARIARASVADALVAAHVRTARAKGLAPRRVLAAHVLRCAAGPVVTLLGLEIGALLGGAVLTEAVFGWPGLGSLLADAIARRDYPVLQGCVLLIALAYVLAGTLAELAYGALDPRVREGG